MVWTFFSSSLNGLEIEPHDLIGTSLNSSGGVATGKAVFSVYEAKEYFLAKVPCILVALAHVYFSQFLDIRGTNI